MADMAIRLARHPRRQTVKSWEQFFMASAGQGAELGSAGRPSVTKQGPKKVAPKKGAAKKTSPKKK